MNIHISGLLQKMEEELQKAKNSNGNEEIKLHAAVIKSLCDVILESGQSDIPKVQEKKAPAISDQSESMLHQLMGAEGSRKYEETKKKEKKDDEANGDSIFDF
ncbi:MULTISPECIES: YwdI family protein [Bacillus]|uniref:YwdI family protein n=2 Tax=Bacillus TaxID=1386 RepID=A0A0M5JC83_9BACI|nr:MULTISPECIES: YwdI family protein [Bacillus]ALC82794.1 hypothetical protein AM592_15280 [Bacillus gobiensis]MBP1081755.1 hypothetical protein [Bacillus capparidis]MED1096406.1 YwdI family protein [Bacillus capparidis]